MIRECLQGLWLRPCDTHPIAVVSADNAGGMRNGGEKAEHDDAAAERQQIADHHQKQEARIFDMLPM
jgi:hypothetical protein